MVSRVNLLRSRKNPQAAFGMLEVRFAADRGTKAKTLVVSQYPRLSEGHHLHLRICVLIQLHPNVIDMAEDVRLSKP